MIKEVTDKHFTKKNNGIFIDSLKKTGGMLIVKTEWCGFCRSTLPILEELSKKLGQNYPIVKLDADSNSLTTKMLGVQGFPTIFYIDRNGKIGNKHDGDRTVPVFLTKICEVSLICKK